MALNRIQVLNSELTSDPLARGYSVMSDQQAADDLNTPYRILDVINVKASAVLEATVIAEYNALNAAKQELYRSMLAVGELNPNGANIKAVFADLFGTGTTTRANLLALSGRNASRAAELLGDDITVTANLVASARSYMS